MTPDEIEARLSSEKFVTNLLALAASEPPSDPTTTVQYDVARMIAKRRDEIRQLKGGRRDKVLLQLGELLEGYVEAYGVDPDCY